MAYKLVTKNNHSFYDMAAMLQKAIRRCDYARAGYAASELFDRYNDYLWKRLLIISAEDCYGIMTKEIVALKQAQDMIKKKETIFVSKAICLLCYARKNRDGDYFACCLMNSDTPIPEDQIEHVDITKLQLEGGKPPDWTYDMFTIKGKAAGKDAVDMVINEQKALTPHQPGLFDDEDWEQSFKKDLKEFNPKHRPVEGVHWSQWGGSAGKQFPEGQALPKIAGKTDLTVNLAAQALGEDEIF
jgi:hypothetical protein